MPFSASPIFSATATDDSFSQAITASLDSTGADIIFAAVAKNGNGVAATMADNKGNTWNGLTAREVTAGERIQIFYAINPTVGSGHIFTGGGTFVSMVVAGFSGGHLSSPFDTGRESGNDTFGTTLSPGSITPSVNDALVLQALAFNTVQSGLVAISAGYTIIAQLDRIGAARMGIALAFQRQTTAAATNPTWTAALTSMAAVSAAFIPATGGGGGGGTPGTVFLNSSRRRRA